jgi:hypothetical protein
MMVQLNVEFEKRSSSLAETTTTSRRVGYYCMAEYSTMVWYDQYSSSSGDRKVKAKAAE